MQNQNVTTVKQWLFNLRHAALCDGVICSQSESCEALRLLLSHMRSCSAGRRCTHPSCWETKELLRHYQWCNNPACNWCLPVREKLFVINFNSPRRSSNIQCAILPHASLCIRLPKVDCRSRQCQRTQARLHKAMTCTRPLACQHCFDLRDEIEYHVASCDDVLCNVPMCISRRYLL